MNTHFFQRTIGVALVRSALGFAVANASAAQPTAGHAVPKPAWPDNGIAQRMLPNASMMFVENDHGKLRAWVVSEPPGGENEEALDFFSGQKMKVKVDREEDGHQEQSFKDSEGKSHSSTEQNYVFSGISMPIELPGITFEGNNILIKSSAAYCPSSLSSTRPKYNNFTKENPSYRWEKFTIYHVMGVPKCPNGMFESEITSALDLNDGTFLAVENCFVFRLRKSNLLPVGSAPALRVIDTNEVKELIDQAKTGKIEDITDHLVKTLNLPISDKFSCK